MFSYYLRTEYYGRLRHCATSIQRHCGILNKSSRGRESAVLIPLVNLEGFPSVIFTHRSLLLPSHRGEVSFPGGRLERGETYEEGAVRESVEEIGLDDTQVKIWGCLKPITTPRSASIVTPVVGMIQDIDISTITAKPDEVQTVFAAPIDELCMRHHYTNFRKGYIQYKLPVFFTSRHRIIATNVVPQKQYRIWGLTAFILHLALLNLFPESYQSKIENKTLL